MIAIVHLPEAPPAYIQVQAPGATAQPGGNGPTPRQPEATSPLSAPARAPTRPPARDSSGTSAAGAAGTSAVAQSSAPPSGHAAAASDNGGNLPGAAVPGGVNHAPNQGGKPGSFSGPIKK